MIDIEILLAWGAVYKPASAEEIIFQEGNPCNFYYQLIEGSIRWVNIDESGKEFIQIMVQPNEPFGILPLFDNEPYAATAITNTDSLLLRLHQSTFLQMLKEHPEIHVKFSTHLAGMVRNKFSILKAIALNNPEHTISYLLQNFKEKNQHICPKCQQLKLTRQQIAGMTGLRVETVIRTMRQMHHKGLIKIKHGKVYLFS